MNRETFKIQSKIIASNTQELYDLAISKGIQMPHPALAIFKSTLCEVEKANANGVRLGAKATDVAVSTLIGTQINKNHGRSEIMGHVIDAQITDKKYVDIVCIFFKDLYEDDWAEAQELFNKNELTMSFELSADVESQEHLMDGTKRLNDYYFTGAGLLFGVKPACKKARVFEMATKKLQEKLSMERQSLIFANNQNSQKSILEVLNLMADEVKKIEEVKVEEPIVAETLKIDAPKVEEEFAESEREIEDAAKWTTKFINSLPDSSFAVIEPAYKEGKTDNKNARHLPFKDASGKIDLPHYRNALARANQIKAITDSISDEELRKQAMAELEKHRDVLKAEEKPVEEAQKLCPKCNQPMEDDQCAKCKKEEAAAPKVEEVVAQPVEVPKVEDVVVVIETTQKVTDTMLQNSETIKVETEVTKSVNDQVKEERKEVVEVTYTYAQMEEVKAKYETEIASLKEQLVAKDKEVETLKAAKEVKVEAQVEEPVVLPTGHKTVDASTEDSSSPIAKILKTKRSYRK